MWVILSGKGCAEVKVSIVRWSCLGFVVEKVLLACCVYVSVVVVVVLVLIGVERNAICVMWMLMCRVLCFGVVVLGGGGGLRRCRVVMLAGVFV